MGGSLSKRLSSKRLQGPGTLAVVGRVLLSLLLLGAAGLAGCAAREVSPPPPPVEVFDKGPYVIGSGDVLALRVWRNPELSVEVPVRNDGKISVPLLDDVHAEGLTTDELKELLTQALSEYISNPNVTVIVRNMTSKRAFLIGGVQRSGPIPLATNMRILDALAAAGGFTTFADKKRVKIIRQTENGEVEYRFDYDAYIAGKAPGTNLRLLPGDTIVIPN